MRPLWTRLPREDLSEEVMFTLRPKCRYEMPCVWGTGEARHRS